MADLIAHLESFLGEISGGSRNDDATPPGVQVVWFGPDVPFDGVVTVATLGLSNHHLAQPSGGLHQELLMHVPSRGRLPGIAAGVLFQVAGELIARGRGLCNGEVLGPRNRLFGEGETTAVVAASPVYLPDEFAVCEAAAGPVVMTWLMPITTTEAEYAQTHGWAALQDAFVAANPDLTDPGRAGVDIGHE